MAEKQRSSSLANESFATHSNDLQIKSCPRCIHLLRDGVKANIHSTLAYTRCRCHRTWKFLSETPNIGNLTNRQLQLEPLSSSVQTPVQIYGRHQLAQKKEAKLKTNWKSDSINDIIKPKIRSHLKPERDCQLKKFQTFKPVVQASGLQLQTSGHQLPQNHRPLVDSSHYESSTKPSLPLLVDDSNCSASSQTVLPPLATHQLTNVLSSVRLDGSTTTLLSPASSKIRLEKTSPKQSRSKLPQINSSTKLHPLYHIEESSPASDVVMTERTPQPKRRFELVHLLQHISSKQRSKLDSLFTKLDENGDGHLTYHEFLAGLPSEALQIQDYLRQFYSTLSDLTYFGRREFILAHCVLNSVLQSELAKCTQSHKVSSTDHYSVTEQATRDTHHLSSLLCKLPTVLSELSVHVHDHSGLTTTRNIQDVITKYNKTALEHSKLQLNTSRLTKVSSINLIDLLALAAYYFKK